MSVFVVVFSFGLRAGGIDWATFLLCALVPWKWFQGSIASGSNVIASNKGLISQVYFPKVILVWSGILSSLIKFAVIFALLAVFLLFTTESFSMYWLGLPAIFLTQLLLIASLTTIASVAVAFVSDLRLIIDNLLLLTFFSCGVFFDINERPEDLQILLRLNPMTGLIENYRLILLEAKWPDWSSLVTLSLISAPFLVLGLYLLKKFDRQFAKIAG